MAMVKVKSKNRSGGGASTSKRVGDCSPKGVTKKFKEVRAMTKISPGISTGNKFVDKVVLPKIPVVGKYIKAYNISHDTMANVAKIKATYDETCKKRK